MKRLKIHPGNGAALGGVSSRLVDAPAFLAAAGAVLIIAFVAGYLASSRGAGAILGLLLSALVVYVTLRWPRAGFVALLVMTSTLLAPEFFRFTETKYIYYAYEALLLLVVGSSLLAAARDGDTRGIFERFYRSPVAAAISIFAAVVIIKSLAIIIENRFTPGSISSMYTFNRGLSYYLLFIPALLLFGDVRKQRWMTAVILILGALVAARVLLELTFPEWSLLKFFSVSQPLADETAGVDLSVQRLRAFGGTFMLVGFWVGLMNIVLREWTLRRMAFFAPFTLVMLVGVLLEFNRSYVIPMLGLFVVALFLNKKNVRVKMLTTAAAGLLLLILVFSATGTLDKYIDAVILRYGSAFSSESLESQSVKSREIEQFYAWQKIEESPVLGIGLDELYRPPVRGMLDNLRWYIHNAYIWLWTYFGILGLGAFMAVLGISLFRNFTNWRRVRDPLLQAAVLGFSFSIATLMAANLAAPKFYDLAAVPVVALMLGLAEAIIIPSRSTPEGTRPGT